MEGALDCRGDREIDAVADYLRRELEKIRAARAARAAEDAAAAAPCGTQTQTQTQGGSTQAGTVRAT